MAGERTRQYKIEVSYVTSRNSAAVFQEAERSSARARSKIEADAARAAAKQQAEAQRAADAESRAADRKAAAAARAYAQIEKEAARAAAREAAEADRAAQAKVRADQRAFDQKLRLAQQAARQQQRLREQEEREIIASAERAARQEEAARKRAVAAATRERGRAIKGFASDTYNNISGMASRALGLAGTLASGMGVNLDLNRSLSTSGEFKRNVVDVTNAGLGIQGKLAGKGDYAATTKAVESAADYTKLDQNKVLAGLSVFVDKASDIEAGKAMLKGLGDIAQASGTDFVELAGSAGEFFKMMGGEGPEKIKNVQKLLALAAKQGQVGNLAFKELAPTIGKLAAQGQKISGNYADNLGDLMALSQVSLRGGAAKGAEATRSAQAFVMDMTKGGALKSFAKHGVKVFEDQNAQGGGTVLRQMEPLILEFIKKSKGDLRTLSDEFKGTKSGAVITGFANIARDAANQNGGIKTEKGLKAALEAVKAEFEKYRQPMSEAEIQNSANAVRGTSTAQAEAFNNQLQRIAGSLADRLLPQFEKLAPKMLELVDAFAKVVAWAAENPGTAIVAAITASIAKAALGAAISQAITTLIQRATGTAVPGGGLGAGAGALGKLGAGLAIAATAATITVAGMAVIDDVSKKGEKGRDARENMDIQLMNAVGRARAAAETGVGVKEAMAELQRVEAIQKNRIDAAKDPTGFFGAINPFSSKGFEARAIEQGDAEHMAEVKEGLNRVERAIAKLKDGELKVRVSNMPNQSMTPVDGRSGVQGHGG